MAMEGSELRRGLLPDGGGRCWGRFMEMGRFGSVEVAVVGGGRSDGIGGNS